MTNDEAPPVPVIRVPAGVQGIDMRGRPYCNVGRRKRQNNTGGNAGARASAEAARQTKARRNEE